MDIDVSQFGLQLYCFVDEELNCLPIVTFNCERFGKNESQSFYETREVNYFSRRLQNCEKFCLCKRHRHGVLFVCSLSNNPAKKFHQKALGALPIH